LRLPPHGSGPEWLASPSLYDSLIRYSMPVAPKTSTTSAGPVDELVRSIRDLYRYSQPTETAKMMVRTALAAPLLRCILRTPKGCSLLQHAVQNDQHLVRYGHNRTFLTSPR